MLKAIQNLINWGTQSQQGPLTRRRIRLLNVIAWAGVVVFLFYAILLGITNDLILAIMNIIGAGILFLILLLNKNQYYYFARIGLCLDLSLFFFITALGLGKSLGLQYFLITTSVFPLLFFDNKTTISLMFSFNVLCLVVVQIGFEYIPPFFHQIQLNYTFAISIINFVNASLILLISIGSFKKAVFAYQETIENNNLEMMERSMEITIQNATIQKKNSELSEAYQQIKDSVYYAQRIQNALLGNPDSITRHFPEAFILLKPKDIVSGDFYWFSWLRIGQEGLRKDKGNPPSSESWKFLVAADCTGHGVPGAFMTVMGSNFLDEIINQQKIIDPAEILYNLDQKIVQALAQQNNNEAVNDGMDLALLVWNEANEEIYFAGAKSPLYYVRNGKISQIKGNLYPIGNHQYKKIKTFKTHTLKVQKGDIFYMFSDGFQDQFGGVKSQKYYKKKFREFLLKISQLPLQEQKVELQKELQNWKGEHEQTDDVLVMGIKVY